VYAVPGFCDQVDGDLWKTAKFIDSVKIPYIAPSLGGVESLIEQPTVISYWDQVRGRRQTTVTLPDHQHMTLPRLSAAQQLQAVQLVV
jgi:hypothetical protein